jgi:hypothetical protein
MNWNNNMQLVVTYRRVTIFHLQSRVITKCVLTLILLIDWKVAGNCCRIKGKVVFSGRSSYWRVGQSATILFLQETWWTLYLNGLNRNNQRPILPNSLCRNSHDKAWFSVTKVKSLCSNTNGISHSQLQQREPPFHKLSTSAWLAIRIC